MVYVLNIFAALEFLAGLFFVVFGPGFFGMLAISLSVLTAGLAGILLEMERTRGLLERQAWLLERTTPKTPEWNSRSRPPSSTAEFGQRRAAPRRAGKVGIPATLSLPLSGVGPVLRPNRQHALHFVSHPRLEYLSRRVLGQPHDIGPLDPLRQVGFDLDLPTLATAPRPVRSNQWCGPVAEMWLACFVTSTFSRAARAFKPVCFASSRDAATAVDFAARFKLRAMTAGMLTRAASNASAISFSPLASTLKLIKRCLLN